MSKDKWNLQCKKLGNNLECADLGPKLKWSTASCIKSLWDSNWTRILEDCPKFSLKLRPELHLLEKGVVAIISPNTIEYSLACQDEEARKNITGIYVIAVPPNCSLHTEMGSYNNEGFVVSQITTLRMDGWKWSPMDFASAINVSSARELSLQIVHKRINDIWSLSIVFTVSLFAASMVVCFITCWYCP